MKPNWKVSPPWAQYASQELSGSWYWHEHRPKFQELTGEWVSTGKRQIMPKVEFSARQSMEERPSA